MVSHCLDLICTFVILCSTFGLIIRRLCFFFFWLLYCVFFFVFFFSSRRRHTRFDCDWSSDVCSSDLLRFENLLSLFLQFVADAGFYQDVLLTSADEHGVATHCDAVEFVR